MTWHGQEEDVEAGELRALLQSEPRVSGEVKVHVTNFRIAMIPRLAVVFISFQLIVAVVAAGDFWLFFLLGCLEKPMKL